MELHFDHLECILFGFTIGVVTTALTVYLDVENEPSYVTKCGIAISLFVAFRCPSLSSVMNPKMCIIKASMWKV